MITTKDGSVKIYKVVTIDSITHRIDNQAYYFSNAVAELYAKELQERIDETAAGGVVTVEIQTDYVHNEPITL
tara:strand:+ start:1816 stop:2034 length:219 start_codon:yes stop_codon:yes gene_type:complete